MAAHVKKHKNSLLGKIVWHGRKQMKGPKDKRLETFIHQYLENVPPGADHDRHGRLILAHG